MSVLNLGYGLGGLVQGYQQQQQNASRNALLEAYLKQQQNQLAAQRAEGLALMAGGIPGLDPQALGGGNAFGGAAIPQPPLPGTSSQPVATAPQAPMAPSPAVPAAPSPSGPATPSPSAGAAPARPVPSLGDMLPSQGSPDLPDTSPDPDLLEPPPAARAAERPPVAADPALPSGMHIPEAGSEDRSSPYAPNSPGRVYFGSPSEHATFDYGAAPASPAAPPAQGAGAPAAPPQRPDPAPQVPTSESGHVIISDPKSPGSGGIDLGTLMNHASPVEIAQRIHAADPSASPEAVAIATQNIYKLASQGDKLQQMMVAKVLGLQVQMRSQDIRQSEGAANRQVRQSEGAANRDVRRETQAGVQGRFDQREGRLKAAELDREAYRRQQMALQQERELRLKGNAAAADAARKRSQDIQRIRAQIYSIVGGKGVAGVDEEGQKKLIELEKELQRLSGAQ